MPQRLVVLNPWWLHQQGRWLLWLVLVVVMPPTAQVTWAPQRVL
jgi:hypothetical protein